MKTKLLVITLAAAFAWEAQAQTIQPVPHKISRGTGIVSITEGVKYQGVDQADTDAVELLQSITKNNKKGVNLRIGEVGDKIFAKENISLPTTSGSYFLKVDPGSGITIIGADERGTYYGVQTFKQLVNQGELPVIEITDYPDILFRGSVEGFYGKPWSHRDRLAQLEFYGENKLNTYIYGPKDDPYHSSLSNHNGQNQVGGWRIPYPEAEGKNISELAATAKKHKVDFVWAIHPGQDIKWNEEDFKNLLNKFNSMYDLGVRSYAVFFDDISGEGTNPVKQAELLNRLNTEFVKIKKDVTPLILCPTEYNKSWANPGPKGYLSILGDKLDPSIQVMWTGDRVCADITMETLNWINERIKRPTYIWWNFPVTDYIRHKVLLGPSYGLDTRAASKDMAGFVSNPMENAEASKIALYGVADYSWNIAAYDYLPTWERAIKNIMPTAPKAFRTLAIHSADMDQNGHGYRRDESWETKAIDPLNYSEADYKALHDEFAKLTAAPATILNSGANPYMLQELKPWLVQAHLLGVRGTKAMEVIKTYQAGEPSAIWSGYLNSIITTTQSEAFDKNKLGTLVLLPFITKTNTILGEKLYEKLSGSPLQLQTPLCSFDRTETLPSMLDGSSDTYYYSWDAQKVGDWVGVDLGKVETVSNILIEQGRKDGDRDYFQFACLEYSTDNKTWTTLKQVTDSTYAIKYNSHPVEARYVRLRATEGCSRKNWTAIRRFDVNPLQSKPIIMTNIAQVAAANVTTSGATIAIQPMLEIVKVAPDGYFGIELPMAAAISAVNMDLNLPKAVVEYSADGTTWSAQASQARYIRYINRSAKPVELNLRKFEVQTSTSTTGELINLIDKDFTTIYALDGTTELVPPTTATAISILSTADSKATVNCIAADGTRTQLGELSGNFAKFDIPKGATSIVIEGKATIHEVIFKN